MLPQGVLILLIVVGFTAVIAIIAFIIYRLLRPKLKEEKPSEEEILQDELNRVLQTVEDDQAAEEIAKYKEDELLGRTVVAVVPGEVRPLRGAVPFDGEARRQGEPLQAHAGIECRIGNLGHRQGNGQAL